MIFDLEKNIHYLALSRSFTHMEILILLSRNARQAFSRPLNVYTHHKKVIISFLDLHRLSTKKNEAQIVRSEIKYYYVFSMQAFVKRQQQ